MKVVAQNRRARFDYEVLETIEAGLMLTGQEVKSCRMGHCDLKGSYMAFQGAQPVLRQMTIRPYPAAGPQPDYNPSRVRPLLLSKKQIVQLQEAGDAKGFSVIPLEIHAGRYVKVLLAIARGRKKFDKRQKIKEREVKQRIRREA